MSGQGQEPEQGLKRVEEELGLELVPGLVQGLVPGLEAGQELEQGQELVV